MDEQGKNSQKSLLRMSATAAAPSTTPPRGRLLVVANRLPFTIELVKKPVTNAASDIASAAAASAAAASLSPPTPASSAAPALAAFAHAVAAQAHASHHHPTSHHHSSQPTAAHSSPAASRVEYSTSVSISPSPGGLVSALRGVSMPMHWIGWPGITSSLARKDRNLIKDTLKKSDCTPVFLSTEQWDMYYNGFCNNILWPLFHYIPLPVESLQTSDEQYAAYEAANREFAKKVLDLYREGDVVWVHDYQLMLLPEMLRKVKPNMTIGFFLHIPFPSSEIYRVLPSRKQLLLGVLSANLIGFHTHDYSRHFQSACTRILGATCSNDIVRLDDPTHTRMKLSAHVGTFPIGIDPQRFLTALETPGVQNLVRELRTKFGSRHVILGIDRLDYVKGILHKLYAFEKFFELHPEYIGKVVLIQIAVPSRVDVPEYQKLRDKAHELVGKICGRFGNLMVQPIHYLDCSLSFEHMTSLYRFADITLITSVRDGMNLVAYEYIACQKGRNGVLILSEFAGASQSLGAGAIQVNPWSFTELADAIYQGLCMSPHERQQRTEFIFAHVMKYTAQAWSTVFLQQLEDCGKEYELECKEEQERTSFPPLLQTKSLVQGFKAAKKRLVILGLAGTLSHDTPLEVAGSSPTASTRSNASLSTPSPHLSHPSPPSASPSSSLISEIGGTTVGSTAGSFTPQMSSSLEALSNDPHTTVVVLTSRSRAVLEKLLGERKMMWLSAENGFFLRKGVSSSTNFNAAVNTQQNSTAHSRDTSFDALNGSHQSKQQQQQTHDFLDASFAPISSPTTAAVFLSTTPPSFLSSSASHHHTTGYPWQILHDSLDLSWRSSVSRVFEYFTVRTPHSFISSAETHMSWHYHNCHPPQFARRQVNDLTTHLTGGPLSNTATEVLDNSGIVQVRPLGMSKGAALRTILQALARRQRNQVRQAQLLRARQLHWQQLKSRKQQNESVDNEQPDAFSWHFPPTSVPTSPKVEQGSLRSKSSGTAVVIAAAATDTNHRAKGGALPVSKSFSYASPTQSNEPSAAAIADVNKRRPSSATNGRARSGSWSQIGSSYSTTSTLHLTPIHPKYAPSTSDEIDHDEECADSNSFDLLPPSALHSSLSPPTTSSTTGTQAESIEEMISSGGFDFVMCLGNFLERDEDVFRLLNPVGVVEREQSPLRSESPPAATPAVAATATSTSTSTVSTASTSLPEFRNSSVIDTPTPTNLHIALRLDRTDSDSLPQGFESLWKQASTGATMTTTITTSEQDLFSITPSPSSSSSSSPTISIESSPMSSAEKMPSWSDVKTSEIGVITQLSSSPSIGNSIQVPLPSFSSFPTFTRATSNNHPPPASITVPAAFSSLPHSSTIHTSSLSSSSSSSSRPPLLPSHPTITHPLIATIAVGRKVSPAHWHLPDRVDVEMLLKEMAASCDERGDDSWSGERSGASEKRQQYGYESTNVTTTNLPTPLLNITTAAVAVAASTSAFASPHPAPLTPLLEATNSPINSNHHVHTTSTSLLMAYPLRPLNASNASSSRHEHDENE